MSFAHHSFEADTVLTTITVQYLIYISVEEKKTAIFPAIIRMSRASLEDDPIVRTLKLYVKRDMNLNLIQFPLRPAYLDEMSMGFANVKEARMKPKAGIMEMVAEQGGHAPVKMRSIGVAEDSSLGIGVIKGDSFYITPVDKVLQMRPYFSDIPTDERDERGDEGLTMGNGMTGGDDDNEMTGYYSQSTAKKKVEANVGLTGQRLQSFILQKRVEEREPFIELATHQINSIESESVFNDLRK